MILALTIALAFMLHLWVTFTLFGSVCALQRVRDEGNMPRPMLVLGLPVLWVGLLLDALLHLVWGTLIFADLPARGEWLLTARLVRYKRQGAGWRCRLALWVCAGLLDRLDPKGCHCRID